MKRKHTKSFLLVSVAATFTGCGGSTEDGSTDRGSERQQTSEDAANMGPEAASMAQSNVPTPLATGITGVPFYGEGVVAPSQPAQSPTQSQVPTPGMGGGDQPVFGDPVEPGYVAGMAGTLPIPGIPVTPDYGGQGGIMPVGSSVAPVYVGDPVEPDYGGQGGIEQFPGLPAIPEYGGAAGQPPIGGASGGTAIGGSSGAPPIGGSAGAAGIGGSAGDDAIGGAAN